MARGESEASTKWLGDGCGEHYRLSRFKSRRAAGRDLECVRALLEQLGARDPVERLLDVPCGSGRLSRELAARARRYVGVDVSRPMLRAAAPLLDELAQPALAIEARAPRLPFRDGCFDVVVACRFLHHLHEEQALGRAIGELARVSRGLVIASFWDASSLPQWRRSLGLKRAEGPSGRVAVRRERIESCFDAAGADVIAWRATLRFVSQQTFVAARVRARST